MALRRRQRRPAQRQRRRRWASERRLRGALPQQCESVAAHGCNVHGGSEAHSGHAKNASCTRTIGKRLGSHLLPQRSRAGATRRPHLASGLLGVPPGCVRSPTAVSNTSVRIQGQQACRRAPLPPPSCSWRCPWAPPLAASCTRLRLRLRPALPLFRLAWASGGPSFRCCIRSRLEASITLVRSGLRPSKAPWPPKSRDRRRRRPSAAAEAGTPSDQPSLLEHCAAPLPPGFEASVRDRIVELANLQPTQARSLYMGVGCRYSGTLRQGGRLCTCAHALLRTKALPRVPGH